MRLKKIYKIIIILIFFIVIINIGLVKETYAVTVPHSWYNRYKRWYDTGLDHQTASDVTMRGEDGVYRVYRKYRISSIWRCTTFSNKTCYEYLFERDQYNLIGVASSGGGSSGGSSSSSGGGISRPYIPPDTTPPSCSISANYGAGSLINAGSISYTISFSENVYNFTQSDININAGSISFFSGSGSRYYVTVNTNKATYTQNLSISGGVCNDAAGNGNYAGGTYSINIDRDPPQYAFSGFSCDNFLSQRAKEKSTISKENEVVLNFKVTDANYSGENLTANDITVKVGGTAITPTKKEFSKNGIGNGASYTLKLAGLTRDGALSISIPQGKATDRAGNGNSATSFNTGLIVDNTPPAVKTASLTGANEYGFVKNGSTVVLNITFSEELIVDPTVMICGRKATVTTTNHINYTASYTIPEDEAEIKEGYVWISISDYQDVVTLVGSECTATTDGSRIIYDRTPPECSVSKNGNTKWLKSQSTTVIANDNFTPRPNIECKHAWGLEDEAVTINQPFKNVSILTKDKVTGKYRLHLKFKDLAGNYSEFVTEPFYIDNTVTEIGKVKITKDSKDGLECESGAYTRTNFYLTRIDGRDEESGHNLTYYEVYKVLDDGTEVAIGTPTIEDSIIETEGNYKIYVKTVDNLGNMIDREGNIDRQYILHIYRKAPEITFTPDGNNIYEHKTSVKIEASSPEVQITKPIQYSVQKQGENPTYDKSVENGGSINIEGLTGDYYIYAKAEDEIGNIIESKSKVFHFDNEVTKPATLIMKKNSESGEDYINNTYTKDNVYLRISDMGHDDQGGNVVSNYVIKKRGEIVVGPLTNESTVLTEEGYYEVIVTSTDERNNQTVQNFMVKIDKVKPVITFKGIENYLDTGKIVASVQDDGEYASGVRLDSLRYYWTRQVYEEGKTPSKEDFEGDTTGGFRGKMLSTIQAINIPKEISGTWSLWIYAEDNAGNINIKESQKIDGDGIKDVIPPIAGTLEMRENNKDGKEYENDTFTNKDIYLKLLNGYDSDSGVKSNKFDIIKDGKVIETELEGEYTLTQHGIYKITITTIDNCDNKAIREYSIRIDKNAPKVEFTQNEDKTIKTIISETETEAGINEEKTTYLWIGYNREKYLDLEELKAKIEEVVKNGDIEGAKNQLANIGIYVYTAIVDDNKIAQLPNGKEAKYHLVVYSEDKVGNGAWNYSKMGYDKNSSGENPKDDYEVEENENGKEDEFGNSGYIKRVYPETTKEEFLEKIKKQITGKDYQVYDKNGEEITEGEFVTTISKLVIDNKKYVICVIGDINSDGKLSLIDLAKIKNHVASIGTLEGAYYRAADINNDDKVTLIDMVLTKQILVGLISVKDY